MGYNEWKKSIQGIEQTVNARQGYGAWKQELITNATLEQAQKNMQKSLFESQKPLFEAAKELGVSILPKYETGSALMQTAMGNPTTPAKVFKESTSGNNLTKYLQSEIQNKIKENEAYHQEIINFDSVAAEKEIAELEKRLANMPTANWDTRGNMGQAQAQKNADAVNEIKAQIAEKKIALTQKKRLQELLKSNDTAVNDPDFDKYVKNGKEISWQDVGKATGTSGGPNVSKTTYDDLGAAAWALYKHNNPDAEKPLFDNLDNALLYEQMTDEEFDLLAYYIGKDKETGGNQAETYVELMKETLQTRKGQEIYEQYLKDNTVLEVLYGIPAGLDQFANGVTSLFNFKDDYIPASPVQVAGSLAREDLADDSIPLWYNFNDGKWENKIFGASLGQMAYDSVQTTANMAPSIAASTLIGLINPTAGAVTGGVLMGGSAAGNAYQEALNNGWGKGEARTYSLLIGASEAVLSATISKVFGGKLVSDAVENAIKGVTNGFARFSLNYGAAFVSEGFEEAAQEVLSPLFENIAFGYNRKGFEDIDWGEVAYSFLLGGLSGGMFETAGSGVKRISSVASVMKEYNTPEKTQNLLKLALSFPAESKANKLATKYNEQVKSDGKLSANKVYNLAVATENVLTERLTKLGETKNAPAIASAALKAVTTGQLTAKERLVLSSSQHGAELLNEINVTEEAETPVLQSNANGENVQPAGVSGTNNGASGNADGVSGSFSGASGNISGMNSTSVGVSGTSTGVSGQNSETVADNINNDIGRNYTTNIQSDGRHHTTKAEQERIKRVCEALGVKMKFVHITKQLMAEYGYTFEDGTLPDGFYDKETDTLYIGYTGIDPVKFVFKHELTHFGEGTAQYTRFVEAVKSSNAFKNWLADITKSDVNNISVAAMEGKVRQMYIDARANLGTEFGVMDAQAEMIADFVGDMLFNNNADALDRMISSLDVKERNAFLQYILDFLSHLKKKLAGEKDLAFEISRLEDHYNRMLSEAIQTKKAAEQNGGVKFSFEGYAEDGKGKYKSNFPQGTPKKAKGERILKYIQEVWSKKPIGLKINEDGMTRYIEAKFDPTYDETKHIFNDATKLMGGNRHGTSSEQRVTLDLADDYYQIASESSYNYSKDEIGKQNPAHEDVKKWHYFVNDIYFAEYDSEEYTPYRVTINVKEKSDGEYVYSFSAEKQRESDTQRTLHAVVNDGNNPDANVELSNNKLTQNKPIVKNNISDSGANNSENGLKFTISRALNNDKIQKAEEMEKKLKGAYNGDKHLQNMDIWKETGLVRDPSGVWVYEIDDGKMRFYPNGDRFKKRKAHKDKNLLINYLHHKELFERYPQLNDTELVIYDFNQPDKKAAYWAELNYIVLDKTFAETASVKEVAETLVHEIQHAAQRFDEREGGASIEYWNQRLKVGTMPKNPKTGKQYTPYEAYRATRGEYEARMSEERLWMDSDEKKESFGIPFYDAENTVSVENELVGVGTKDRHALKFSIPTDREYSEAVEKGDNAALQQMVDDKAKAAGYTERLYHQTDADFTEFNTDNQKAGKYDWELPTGTFLKPSDNDIGLKGKKQMELYAKQQNPLKFRDRAEARQYWRDNVEGYTEAADKIIGIDTEYQNKLEVAAQNTRNYLKKWRSDNPGVDSRQIYSDAEYQRLNDLEDSITDEWEAESDKASLAAKKLIDNYIAQSNYDGVVLESDVGAMGRQTKTYIVFDSSQLKDASPITYDDSGNVIPLSERFSGDKKDIRFSIPQQARESLEKFNRGEISKEEYIKQLDELWGKANETYGMLPQGENSHAPIATPKAVAEDKSTERFTRTIIETGKLTEEMLQGMEEKVLLGDFNYKVISDESATKKAEAAIKNGTAEDIWNETVNTGKGINKNQIAIGEQLLSDAIKNGETKRVLELSAELADVFTRAGQVVQAARLLKKMTGVGRLVSLQRVVNTLNKDMQEKYGENAKMIEIDATLAEQLIKAAKADEIEMVYEDVVKDIASKTPVTWLDKWNAWRYFAMLSNPKTHIRNLVGNTIFVPAARIKDVMAFGMEQAAVKVGTINQSNVTKALIVKKEYVDFAKKDGQSKEVINLLKGNKYNDKTALKEQQRIFKNNVLEFLTNFNSNALEAEDMLFKNKHYIHALAGFLQARGVDLNNVSEDVLTKARVYAVNEARKATFNDESALANWIQKFGKKNLATNMAVEGVLPFKRTPINIIKRGVEYSPLGLTKTLAKGIFDIKKGKITPTEFIDGLASGLTGTGIMLTGMFLASLGCISGGEDDDELSTFEKLLGKQEYAVQILGKSYTIDWAAPACIPFFIGAEIVNTVSAGEDFSISKIGNAVWNSLEPITNLSMLSGIQGVIESARYAEPSQILASIAGDAITSYAMQGVPSLSGALSRTIDPTQRSWYVDKNDKVFDAFSQTLINNIKSKVPGLSYTQIPKIDAWGREVSRGNVGERIAENFISPGYYSKVEYDEVSEELKRIFVETGANVFPKTAAKSFQIDGETKQLTAAEYVTYAKAKGDYAFDYIYEFINGNAYKGLSDAERTDVIENLYKYANAKAKAEVSDYELTKQFKTVTNRERNGGSAIDYYVYLAIQKDK